MSTTEEAATAAEPVSGDSAAAEAAPAEPNAAEEKPMKEKKPRTKKPRPKPKPKKSSTPSHPPYFQVKNPIFYSLSPLISRVPNSDACRGSSLVLVWFVV